MELTTDADGRPNRLGMSDPAGYVDTSHEERSIAFSKSTGGQLDINDHAELLGASNVGVGARTVFGRPRTWSLKIHGGFN